MEADVLAESELQAEEIVSKVSNIRKLEDGKSEFKAVEHPGSISNFHPINSYELFTAWDDDDDPDGSDR